MWQFFVEQIMENKKEIDVLNDRMIELYGKIIKIKHKLDICQNEGQCESQQVKDKKIKKRI